MAEPYITSATLNKTSYAPGDTMVLTVVGGDPDEAPVELSITVRAGGAESAPVTVTATVDAAEVVVDDPSGRQWTLTGRTGSTFTLTATA